MLRLLYPSGLYPPDRAASTYVMFVYVAFSVLENTFDVELDAPAGKTF